MEALRVQFFVKLLNEPFEGRAFELQTKLLNWFGEDLFHLRSRFFEVGHRWSKATTHKGLLDQTLVTFWVPGRWKHRPEEARTGWERIQSSRDPFADDRERGSHS